MNMRRQTSLKEEEIMAGKLEKETNALMETFDVVHFVSILLEFHEACHSVTFYFMKKDSK